MRYFDPFKEFEVLRREVDRAFRTFDPTTARGRINGFTGRSAYPLVNITEDAERISVEALVPGVNPDSFEIRVLRNQLTISGERPAPADRAETDLVHRQERAFGKFSRTFKLPTAVDDAKVTADYRNGILMITMPKAEEAKPRKIAITTAA